MQHATVVYDYIRGKDPVAAPLTGYIQVAPSPCITSGVTHLRGPSLLVPDRHNGALKESASQVECLCTLQCPPFRKQPVRRLATTLPNMLT